MVSCPHQTTTPSICAITYDVMFSDVFLALRSAGMGTKKSVPLRQPPTDFFGIVCEFLQLFDDRSPIFLVESGVADEA